MNHKELADRYRQNERPDLHGGVVVIFGNEISGWMNELRDPQSWKPGCFAIDKDGNKWVSVGGNSYDGAESWQPVPLLAANKEFSLRISWQQYFMKMAELAAERSTCIRRKVGAVAVKKNHILATGYNGAPTELKHCEEIGCLRETLHVPSGEKHELCRAVHAEQNVICQAALHGVSLDGAIIYCTNQPCSICAKLIVNAGIKKVIYKDGYPDEMTKEILMGRLIKFEVCNG